jgi:hypothetical protein
MFSRVGFPKQPFFNSLLTRIFHKTYSAGVTKHLRRMPYLGGEPRCTADSKIGVTLRFLGQKTFTGASPVCPSELNAGTAKL